MSDPAPDQSSERRRRRRRATAPQGPVASRPATAGLDAAGTTPSGTGAPEAKATDPARTGSDEVSRAKGKAVPGESRRGRQDTRRPSEHRDGDQKHGGMHDLAGSRHSTVGVQGALRARDVNRPTDDDLAEAERTVHIVRRHWSPPADTSGRPTRTDGTGRRGGKSRRNR